MEDMIMKHEYVAGEKNDIYIENSERKSVLGRVLGTYAKKIKKNSCVHNSIEGTRRR